MGFFPGSGLKNEMTETDEARVAGIRGKTPSNAACEGTTSGFATPSKSEVGEAKEVGPNMASV